MECSKIIIESLSAAFFAPGYNNEGCASLPVPPPSAIQGLVAAVTGNPDENGFRAGWMMQYVSLYEDYEKIVPARRKPDINDFEPFRDGYRLVRTPVKRKYLIEPRLTLYIDQKYEKKFRSPFHTLRLGRSQDMAWVSSMESVKLDRVSEADVEGVILPFPLTKSNVVSFIWALPQAAHGYDERRWQHPVPFAFLHKRQHVAVSDAVELYFDSQLNLAVPFFAI
jgi:CRISPR-associated protein Cas5t